MKAFLPLASSIIIAVKTPPGQNEKDNFGKPDNHES